MSIRMVHGRQQLIDCPFNSSREEHDNTGSSECALFQAMPFLFLYKKAIKMFATTYMNGICFVQNVLLPHIRILIQPVHDCRYSILLLFIDVSYFIIITEENEEMLFCGLLLLY